MINMVEKDKKRLVTLKVSPEARAWFMHRKADTEKPINELVDELIQAEQARRTRDEKVNKPGQA